MQGKHDKKITVMTKTMQPKKPHLQIKVPPQSQNNGVKSGPAGFSTFAKQEQNIASKYQSISTVTSPTHAKNIQPVIQIPQQQKIQMAQIKRKDTGTPINKKNSAKDTPSQKIELQPKLSATALGSPKANLVKQKVLISYGSEKNLNAIKPIQKKQTPQGRASKIQQLQRLLGDQRLRTKNFQQKEQKLTKDVQQLKRENNHLKEQNTELKKKIQKFKSSNEQTKKMLRERINTFNEEGGELQALKQQIYTLQDRINHLLQQNLGLRTQLNKFQVDNISNIKDQRGAIATSVVKQVVPMSGSRISGLYLKDSQQGGELKIFDNLQDMQPDLDLQSYISEKQQSYLQDYRANNDAFDKIRLQYEQILANIQLKYKNLCEDYEQTIASQAGQLYDLQVKNDELRQNGQQSVLGLRMSLEMDEGLLKAQQQITKLTLNLFELKSSNKELIQQSEQHKAQCKFLSAELQIANLKKKFKDQNDKFEFNVVKLNLLNIIDKLKLQIDRQKQKFKSFKARVSSSEN